MSIPLCSLSDSLSNSLLLPLIRHTHTRADTHSNKAWLNVALHHVCHHTGPRFLLLAQCPTLKSSKNPSQNKQCQQNATWSSHTFRRIRKTAPESFACYITLTPAMLFLHRDNICFIGLWSIWPNKEPKKWLNTI